MDVAVEVLSPADSFQGLMRKCKSYADWGITTIVVLDPDTRECWIWEGKTLKPTNVIQLSNGNKITMEGVFAELDASL